MTMRLIHHHTNKSRRKSADERKLIAERLAQRERSMKHAAANRPKAKTAARKAFEAWWGPVQGDAAAWVIWQAAWRAARGAKPTTRKDMTLDMVGNPYGEK